uniref:Parallel spindle 1 n=1 Tax=Dianthus caryophyllus TaxID=3570 RepID=A0A0M5L6W9_DIACA|nr:parallel spindle 1 [Dianthus caryophyllus]
MSTLQKEREIPVFTVWKNNAILKNIFLIDNPPNFNDNQERNDDEIQREVEETLLVGRHPDCDIRLEHPSISRFHLRIHSLPTLNLLFITDLSSVHGTWVSDRRIEPNIRTPIKVGDHLRIGGSSRVYKLHWIPLSLAYDVSKPFVPPLDFSVQREDEDEIVKDEISVRLEDEKVNNVDNISDDVSNVLESLDLCNGDETVAQKPVLLEDVGTELVDVNFEHCDGISRELVRKEMLLEPLTGDNESENEDIQSMDSLLEGLVPLFLGENWEWVGQDENCLPRSTEDDNHLLSSKETEKDLGGAVLEGSNDSFSIENLELLTQRETSSATLVPEHMEFPKAENVDDIKAEGRQDPTEVDHCLPSTGFVSPVLEGSNVTFVDENSEMLHQKTTSLEAPISEDVEFSTAENMDGITADGVQELVSEVLGEAVDPWSFWCGTLVESSSSPVTAEYQPLVDTLFLDENFELLAQKGTSSATENIYNLIAEGKNNEFAHEIVEEDVEDKAWSFWCGSHQPGVENDKTPNESAEALSKKASSGSSSSDLNSPTKEHPGSELWSFWSGKMGVESVCSALSDAEPFSDSEYKSLPNGYLSSPMISSGQNSAHGFWSKRELPKDSSCGDCYRSPTSNSSVIGRLGSPLMTSDQNPMDSIWLRRGKLASAPQVLTSRTEEKKGNSNQKNAKRESISRTLFKGNDDEEEEEEEEVFTPDKENFTPTTHKSMRKFTILKEINNNSSPGKSPLSKMTFSPDSRCVDVVSPLSDKENYSTRTKGKKKTATRGSANRVRSVKLKERNAVRMPFQSLLANSPQKSDTEYYIAELETRNASSVDDPNVITRKVKCVKEELQQWNMVVDTTTLLNKESRKALQLLEGLKGTKLIVPRIVITELSSLKRQLSFFRRNTEVLSALEWIQECMLKTGWWIQVRNSAEEGRPVAPTPPASPQTASYSFSGFSSRTEVLSPTVEDDVLEFALGFRKSNPDGQLVLLSNDISMKIKAMAEGMICETGEEFRESLVNPFSERFRWTDSSPRGQTWSCADDFVLKERFYPSSLNMMTSKSRGTVKGLKLILQHNSQYHERVNAAA